MNRLLKIGFEKAGDWTLADGELNFEPLRYRSQRNILYAFVCDGEVKYVGKTVRSLVVRLRGYRRPGPTQSTNIKNNVRIREALAADSAVEIYVLPDNGLMHYGQFHLNLAAGLEDNIIAILQPEWNGGPRTRIVAEIESDAEWPDVIDTFEIVLHKTYFNSGFFNVPVAHEGIFGADGQRIEINCGNRLLPVTGSINRRCNTNNTPRIMGGVELRDWFRESAELMGEITIRVFSATSIRIVPATEEPRRF